MQRLYQFYLLFREYVIFTLLVLLSLSIMALNDNPQVRRIRSLTIGFVGIFQSSLSSVPNVFALQRENELLRRMNINLADEVNQLREAKLENLRLRSLIGLKETLQTRLVAAKVVAKNLQLLRNTLTLDVGEHEGVHNDMPVVTGEGLVGRIVATSENFAVAQVMLNIDFRASGKVQRSRVDGIVAWDSKAILMKNVAKSLDVRIGDAIFTSEYSNAFPSNIKIGVVRAVNEIPGSLFKRVEITPSVDFTRLEEVFVLDYLPNIEKMSLEERAQK